MSIDYRKQYNPRNPIHIPTQPLSSEMGNDSRIELRCELYKPQEESLPSCLVFYMKNALDSKDVFAIDTCYVINQSTIKITELRALIDNHWKLPITGASGFKSQRFVNNLKAAINNRAYLTGIQNLEQFAIDSMTDCVSALFKMDMEDSGFRRGKPNFIKSAVADMLAKKSAITMGGKFSTAFPVTEAVECLQPGDEFVFAMVLVNPTTDRIEFATDAEIRTIFGHRDLQAFMHLIQDQQQYMNSTASVNDATGEKQFNKGYAIANKLAKYYLINKAIDTAGDVAKN